METASPLGAIIDENTKAVTVTPVSNMRVEMRLFMAIFNLSSFPMREMILNPLKHMRITQFRDLHTFDYKGYVSAVNIFIYYYVLRRVSSPLLGSAK